MKKYFRIDLNFFRLSTTDFRKNDFTRISQYCSSMPTDNLRVVGKFCVGKSMIELENLNEDGLHWRVPFISSNFVLNFPTSRFFKKLFPTSCKHSNLMTPKQDDKNVNWQTSYCQLPEKQWIRDDIFLKVEQSLREIRHLLLIGY